MNKSSKGALAAVAAGVVLLGGAGSLAYWTDSATVTGGSINSGKLTLTDSTTGTCASAPWKLDGAESPAGATFVPGTDTVVPGDVPTKQCSCTVGAVGTHLRANLAATGGAATGTLASALTASGTFQVNGTTVSSITSANNGQTLTATISATFQPGADNTTQLKSASLSGFVVTASQIHS
ncbi:MAG: alternate-type signal peptide protein [Marmoricola sp.]|nr:alternate-type signal peptide protein [Marmoricola sp.]